MATETRDRILDVAHRVFNRCGVASVTMRQLAQAAEMSHGNLNYHFRDKGELVTALHDRLLIAATSLHDELMESGTSMEGLVGSTSQGFAIVYDYRFFFRELNWIVREYKSLHKLLLEVEALRRQMYERAFQGAINAGLMAGFSGPEERDDLITNIRIFSDYWVSSAEIYDKGSKTSIVKQHAMLFFALLRPYLTDKGRRELEQVRKK